MKYNEERVNKNLKPIHVIEYQALLDEAEAHKATALALQKEIEKLKRQKSLLINALKIIEKANGASVFALDGNVIFIDKVARDTLQIIKEGNKDE